MPEAGARMRVLAVDDDPVVQRTVNAALRDAGYHVTEARDGEAAVVLAAELRPDIIVMDVMMPPGISGIEATRRIVDADAAARVVMFSVHDSAETVAAAVAAGARSYVTKRASLATLLDAVAQTLDGRPVLIPSPTASRSAPPHRPPGGPAPDRERAPGLESLTEQERVIAMAAATGLTNHQIAARTFLSSHTVNYHLRHIYQKLGINRRVQLAQLANAGPALARAREPAAARAAAGPAGPGQITEGESVATLVSAGAGGDAAAWTEIVRRYGGLVVAVTRQFRLAPFDAQDVAQRVWLHLVEHIGQVREPASLPRYLVTVTRHECQLLLRLNRRSVPVGPTTMTELAGPSADSVEGSVLGRERREMLRDGLAELPDRARQLLVMLVADPPQSYTEISELLDLPVGSIGPTRARALERLRATHAVQAHLREQPPVPPTAGATPARPGG